jgi:uncharacterized protein YeaO (DUF488 family)
MLKTKSVYDKPGEEDGIRILVMRLWCRPLSKEKAKIVEWKRELAPSKELLDDWNNNRIDWAMYEKRYLKEMENQSESIKKLAERAKKETVTLLCKESTDEHCHRRLLKNLIELLIR